MHKFFKFSFIFYKVSYNYFKWILKKIPYLIFKDFIYFLKFIWMSHYSTQFISHNLLFFALILVITICILKQCHLLTFLFFNQLQPFFIILHFTSYTFNSPIHKIFKHTSKESVKFFLINSPFSVIIYFFTIRF